MMNKSGNTLNGTRKFTVRLALATGATMATLLGAQTLALLEGTSLPVSNDPVSLVISATPTDQDIVPSPTFTATNQPATLQPAAPGVVVVKSASGKATLVPTLTSTPRPTATVAPTKKAVVQAAPVQPRPRTRSSRR